MKGRESKLEINNINRQRSHSHQSLSNLDSSVRKSVSKYSSAIGRAGGRGNQ